MITTMPAPCWHQLATTAREREALDEYDPHYTSEAELIEEKGDKAKSERFPGPCRTLACDGCCQEAEDWDVGGVIHWPHDAEPNAAEVLDFEEVDGKVLCEPCKREAERDELRKAGG